MLLLCRCKPFTVLKIDGSDGTVAVLEIDQRRYIAFAKRMHCNAKCNWFTKWLPRTIFEKASCYSNIQVSSPRPHKVISWIQLPRNIPIALRLVPLCNSLGLISHFISNFTFHVTHFTFHVLEFLSNFKFHVLEFISNPTFLPHILYHVPHFTFHVLKSISNFKFQVSYFTFCIQNPYFMFQYHIQLQIS